MKPFNPKNEIAKYDYFRSLEKAKGRDPATVAKVAEHILAFEMFTSFAPFSHFNDKLAEAFHDHVITRKNPRTGKAWAKSTIVNTLISVHGFFDWLSREPGYRSRIRPSHVEYLKPSLKDARIAHAKIQAPWPTMEQARHAFLHMPETTPRQRRDKGVFAIMMLTGIRFTAALSLPLKSVDVVELCLYQYGRDVATKFGKSFLSAFFPVDDCYAVYFLNWVKELRETHLFGHDDPVFPKLKSYFARQHNPQDRSELTRSIMADENGVRKAIQAAFTSQGMPSFRVHAFRTTLTMLANEFCKTPEEFKAWSQNFGHESIHTTIDDYMPVPPMRHRQIIKGMKGRKM